MGCMSLMVFACSKRFTEFGRLVQQEFLRHRLIHPSFSSTPTGRHLMTDPAIKAAQVWGREHPQGHHLSTMCVARNHNYRGSASLCS